MSLGGKAAAHTKGEAFAKIADAVAADAAIEIGAKAEMIIINAHKAKADGTPDSAAQPAIIILQGTNKGSLDKTMDKFFDASTVGRVVVEVGSKAPVRG